MLQELKSKVNQNKLKVKIYKMLQFPILSKIQLCLKYLRIKIL